MVWKHKFPDATFSVDLVGDDFNLVDSKPEAVNFQYQTIPTLEIMKSHYRQLPPMVLYKILNMRA